MSHALILAKGAPPQTPSLSWTQKTVKAVRLQRYRARTDLMWFCHDILGWPDVCEAVHGPLIRHLQAFPRPTDAEMEDLDQFHGFDKETGQPIWVYTPLAPMLELEGPRRRLILDFRSSLKCLRRTQTVTLESGLEKQAQKLEVGDRIWGTRNDGSLEPAVVTVTGIEEQEEQRIYRVTMRSGRVIEVSHNHPFRGITKWIQADALLVGDRIAVLVVPTTEIVWDWVKSVEEIGQERTIGVETSSGTLCLEGVITHNTTINTMGHTIQWIVNYPDISVFLVQANEERAFENINGILGHFRANPRFRSLFPEHVAWESPFAFGTQSSFTTKARRDWLINKHETVITGSITKGAAGKHVHVIKFSDIVDEKNSIGDSGIRMVINQFGLCEPLLISPHFWMDVEGTRYRHSDLYGEIMRSEAKKKKKMWSIYVRGWCQKIGPNGESQKFVPEELAWDDMVGPDGKPVPWWPQRINWEYIQEKIDDPTFGDYNVACQYRNNPSDLSDKSQKAFHMGDFKTITPELFYQNVRVAYYSTTVDTAESWGDMAKKTSDYSAITTCAWDASGRCYVVDVKHGRMSTDDLINKVFEVGRKYRPQWVRIEETGYVRGLKGGFQRLIQLDAVNNNINYPVLNFRFVPRDNQKSKKERILLTLQYPYKKGDIVFLANLAALDWVRAELEMFPGFHDDVLDTLADQWQDREWFGRLVVRNDQAQPQVGPDPLNALNSRQKQAEALMASGAYRDFQFDRMVNGEMMGGGAPFPRHSFSDRIGGL